MHKLLHTSGDSEADLRAGLEAIAGNGRVYVLGLGNLDRADDGAGVLVAHALKKPFPKFSFSEHDGVEGTVLDISETPGDATVFFVDAANIGAPPGTIEVVRKEDINDKEITTHRIAVALMASLLERGGKRSAVICIQPGRIEFREPITEPVERAVKAVASALSGIMAERD
ncbi:MAG: hydrogenase maturation protease [Candidatus Thermoplasmatota archaeon]|nr:hydrogenase maturation protease [Candidatus Thermoplasmatota archaeon]